MSEDKATLNWFFWGNGEHSLEEDFDPEAKDGALAAIKEATSGNKGVEWRVLSDQIVDKIGEVLEIDLGSVIATAWNRYQMLSKYADTETYPPDETILVPMAEHKIQSTHRPYVEILVDEAPLGRLDFDIRLTLDLKGLVLKVRGGRVVEICAGTCQGIGTIKCEDFLIKEQKTKKFKLPGKIDLGEGIKIPTI